MIQTYSTTIRRKEMDAVLTCMVDEKIGPGELNTRLIQQTKEFFKCDGCVAFRSPAIALEYALKALGIEKQTKIMISALAPAWQPAHPCPKGVGHLVLHHQTATRLFLGALVHDAVVVVVLRLGGELLMQHPAHRGQVRQPQRVIGDARLHDGLPLFFHHLAPAVLLRPAAQVQA